MEGLESIAPSNLAAWSNLTVIRIIYNDIAYLDGNLFQNNRRLQRIDFFRNYIQNVGANLLANLSELTHAEFRRNDCIDVVADTREAVENLKTQLLIQCPPLAVAEAPQMRIETADAENSIEGD